MRVTSKTFFLTDGRLAGIRGASMGQSQIQVAPSACGVIPNAVEPDIRCLGVIAASSGRLYAPVKRRVTAHELRAGGGERGKIAQSLSNFAPYRNRAVYLQLEPSQGTRTEQNWIEAQRRVATMESAFLDLELIQDWQTVASVCAKMSSSGRLVICDGCGDIEALIVAFLVCDREEQAWALCGTCIRTLPSHSPVT
jgi:hypothetical protein